MQVLKNHVEALIFCAQEPISIKEIQACLSEMFDAEVSTEDILTVVKQLEVQYEADTYAFSIQSAAGGYQFLTKPAYQASISILLKQKSKRRLSNSALETLSIIVYKQPITKSEIEAIRGVNCDYSVTKLLEKELLEIKGKSDAIGRPILYGTSKKFMEYFGIDSLDDLPTLKDFTKEDENTIGKESEI